MLVCSKNRCALGGVEKSYLKRLPEKKHFVVKIT